MEGKVDGERRNKDSGGKRRNKTMREKQGDIKEIKEK